MADPTKPAAQAAGVAAPAKQNEGDGDEGGADPAPEPTVSQAQHNAAMARMRKELADAKKAASDAAARAAEFEAKEKERADAQLSTEERVNKKLDEIKEQHQKALAQAKAEAEAERSKRHEVLIRNSLMTEVSKFGFYEPDLVVEMLARQVQVTDGDEVAQVQDGIHTSVHDVVAAFAKARPRLVPNGSPSGTGDKGGKPPRAGKVPFGQMTGADLENAALAEINAMRESGRQ